jgi:hypothetical protein
LTVTFGPNCENLGRPRNAQGRQRLHLSEWSRRQHRRFNGNAVISP